MASQLVEVSEAAAPGYHPAGASGAAAAAATVFAAKAAQETEEAPAHGGSVHPTTGQGGEKMAEEFRHSSLPKGSRQHLGDGGGGDPGVSDPPAREATEISSERR